MGVHSLTYKTRLMSFARRSLQRGRDYRVIHIDITRPSTMAGNNRNQLNCPSALILSIRGEEEGRNRDGS